MVRKRQKLMPDSVMKKLAMIKKLGCCFALAFFASAPAVAEEMTVDAYPQYLEMPRYVYEDYKVAYERVFREEAIPYWWAVGLSTAVTLATDEKWIAESQRLGKRLGLTSDDNTRTMISYKGVDILRLPTDLSSTLYFIGDGWTHATIAVGFLATGALTDNEKTSAVGFEVIEGMITTTIATQTLKHITGRQSPSEATKRAGSWDFFPNQKTYFDNVAGYDAFPSGHLAVGSMTLTVIHKNYPDNPWVLPTGVTLLTLLSFQMMNNEVHWASDYPLAIALGYTFGSIAYERGDKALQQPGASSKVEWIPLVGQGELGLGMHYQF